MPELSERAVLNMWKELTTNHDLPNETVLKRDVEEHRLPEARGIFTSFANQTLDHQTGRADHVLSGHASRAQY